MKFITIREGLSIAVDKIESIEVIDQLSSKVTVTGGFNTYIANFPKDVLVGILETGEVEQDSLDPEILYQLQKLNSNNQYFAG